MTLRETQPISTTHLSESLRKEFERETISSLLDLDLYKLTMAQFAWRHFPDVPVKYEFTNRTKSVRIAEFVPQDVLENHLRQIQNLQISDEEIAYLRTVEIRGSKIFQEDYLQSLKDLKLPEVKLSGEGGQYKIEVEGPWSSAIYWETLILSTVNELYYRALRHNTGKTEDEVRAEGRNRLRAKIDRLQAYIEEVEKEGFDGPYFMDFGTRRRYAGDWQEEVVGEMAKAFPKYFIGTSNVFLGQKLDLPVKGTFAHEMDMIFSGIFYDEDEKAGTFISHNKVLEMWYEDYGEPLSVALTDTFGSDFFFDHFSYEQAKNWIGVRQDSGDPIEFGEKTIAFYESKGIDPQEKTIVFSDGLDVETIIQIHRHFKGRTRMIFGWGTTLTNDVGFSTLSLVVKATEANGYGTAKLSDNIAKAIGKPEDRERAIKMTQYKTDYYEECKV